MLCYANPYHLPLRVLVIIGFVGIVLAAAVLLYDWIPWLWQICRWRNSGARCYRDTTGHPLCPQSETFGELATGWEQHDKYGEGYYSITRLNKFGELPAIQELACQLFGHSAWTNDTYNRLVSWLLTNHLAGSRDEMRAMPQPEVVRLLREAVSKKP